MKVDSHQRVKVKSKVNAVRDAPHRSQPSYNSNTRKISYKIFYPNGFFDALEESHEDSSSVTALTAEEEIQRAKQRAHTPGQKRKRPSSKSCLVVGLGEGQATWEIELIWWPDLYPVTEHGQLVVCMFIEKCEF